jgi:hypothetical protein
LRLRLQASFDLRRFLSSGFKLERVPFDLFDNIFLNYFTFEAFERTFYGSPSRSSISVQALTSDQR